MDLQDKSLQCAECGAPFNFSAEEQKFFQEKGFQNEPKRCPSCRQRRKESQGKRAPSYASPRQMYPIVCDGCGKEAEVPFQPGGDRPVYCRDCYSKMNPRT